MPADLKEPNSPAEVTQAGCVRRRVVRFRNGRAEHADDWIASEVPIALSYNGEAHVVMLATPMNLEDFALGFSLSEAIIGTPSELEAIEIHERLEGIGIDLRDPDERAEAVAMRKRAMSGRSSCGLCGKQQLEDVRAVVLEEQVVDTVLSKAKLTDVTVSYEDAVKPAPAPDVAEETDAE